MIFIVTLMDYENSDYSHKTMAYIKLSKGNAIIAAITNFVPHKLKNIDTICIAKNINNDIDDRYLLELQQTLGLFIICNDLDQIL